MLFFIFNTAFSTAQFIGFRGDDPSLNTFQVTAYLQPADCIHSVSVTTFVQSVWFQSMNSLISGPSLTSVQNHEFISPGTFNYLLSFIITHQCPAFLSYSGSGAFFVLTSVFGNIFMMNLVISVLGERYNNALQLYGTESWNDKMTWKLGYYVVSRRWASLIYIEFAALFISCLEYS